MRTISCLVVALLTLALTGILHAQKGYYFPPQWEPHEEIWLGVSEDKRTQDLQVEMGKALSGHVGITLLARSDSLLKVMYQRLKEAGIDSAGLKGYVHPIPNVYIRDVGPRFIRNAAGNLAVADFAWSGYGISKEFSFMQDLMERGPLDNDMAQKLGLPVVSSTVVAEGGGLDVSTTCILTFRETALQRNPGRSLAEIEKEYLRMYGKKKVIWLDRMPLSDKWLAGPKGGNYFGMGANGHIDEYARFVNDSTILIAAIGEEEKDLDPISQADYPIMKENLAILKKAVNTNGRPFRVLTIPVPAYSYHAPKWVLSEPEKKSAFGKAVFKDIPAGDTVRWLNNVSYANFLITNGVVLAAGYWKEGMPESERSKDEQVRQALQSAFPDRKVIQLNPIALNRYGGGMNCATQQQPRSGHGKVRK